MTELSRHGAVVSQSDQPRRHLARAAAVGDDTTLDVRRDIIKPFFDQYLKDGAPKANTPPVLIYNTGENQWDRSVFVAAGVRTGCAAQPTPLYLAPASVCRSRRRAPARPRRTTSTSPIRPSRCRTCRDPVRFGDTMRGADGS